MDIVQPVSYARGIMQILQCAFAIVATFDIDHADCGPGSSVVHARATKKHIVTLVPTVKGQVAVGLGQHVFDQCTRKPDTPV